MRFTVCAVFSVLAGVGSSTALAHHSVSGQFDLTKEVTLKGIVSGVDWGNPHIYVLFDVSDPNGAKVTWKLETFPPGQMKRAGITKELIMGKPAEMVTATIRPPRDGSLHLGYLERLTYQDGHFYQLSSNEEEQLRRRGGQ
jgi:uncharacterized protein DUF6152